MLRNRIIPMSLFLLALSFPIAALAADEQPLSAAAGLTTDDFTLILKIGVPSGLISAVFTLVGVFLTNRTTQKNNREKITAETENISRQLKQRQHEFEIQTKMQFESLHSEEKKKVCWDFLASVSPSVFITKQFKPEKMDECIEPLYLYCKDNYFSYFKNLYEFIVKQDLASVYDKHRSFAKHKKTIYEDLKKYEHLLKEEQTIENFPDKITACTDKLSDLMFLDMKETNIIELYNQYYGQAREAAKKMIWNEPIDKAKPLKFVTFNSEDDI